MLTGNINNQECWERIFIDDKTFKAIERLIDKNPYKEITDQIIYQGQNKLLNIAIHIKRGDSFIVYKNEPRFQILLILLFMSEIFRLFPIEIRVISTKMTKSRQFLEDRSL